MKPTKFARKVKTQKGSRNKSISQLLRAARNSSAYAFVAGLGIWLPQADAATLINLDATGQPNGALDNWPNTGTVAGDFVASVPGSITVGPVGGVSAVTLENGPDVNGVNQPVEFYTGPGMPLSLGGNATRTVEAWIFNPTRTTAEETVFAWGRDTGPSGNAAFMHDASASDGAIEHDGAGPSIDWLDTLEVVTNRWVYLTWVYDGSTGVASVYSDGRLINSEEVGPLNTLATNNVDGGALPFRVGSQNDNDGTPEDGAFAGSIGRIRVHDIAMDSASISNQFFAEKADFGVTDADGDGLSDAAELAAGTDWGDPDTDNDDLPDGLEVTNGTDPLDYDSDDDGFGDGGEVRFGSDPKNAASTPALTKLVDIDATGLGTGPLTNWANAGTLGGTFTVPTNATVPSVTTIDGVNGVSLTTGGTGGTHYVGPLPPAGILGNQDRTITAWVFNPSVDAEEVVMAWGCRGADGLNWSFGHGSNGGGPINALEANGWGAVAMWGTPDIGWSNQEVAGRWTHIAATYDGTNTTRVFVDGRQVGMDVLAVPINTLAAAQNGTNAPIRIGRQTQLGNGAIDNTGGPTLTIAKVQVYDQALDYGTIQAMFDAEAEAFGLVDADGDGLPKWYEIRHGLNDNDNAGNNGAAGDADGDGLTNIEEFEIGTSASNADTDGDGLNDGVELSRVDTGLPAPPSGALAPTNPLNPDTDGDGLRDGVETDTGVFVDANNTGSDPLVNDTDGDSHFDGVEVAQGSNPVSAASVPDPAPVVSLYATNLVAGPLTVWTNVGKLGGQFNQGGGGGVVGVVQGVNAVTLNGGFYTGPIVPPTLTGNPSYSCEAWVLNPTIEDEESIIAWGRRGGPDSTTTSFNYGSNATWGAMTHWGGNGDMGWNNEQIPGRWVHIVYTYNAIGGVQTCYINGEQANQENINPLNIFAESNGGNPLPFRLGAQNADNGAAQGGFRATMSIGEVHVYTRALPGGEITTRFNQGADFYGINDSDGDGMPDWFERTYAFLNEDNAADGAQDFDGDGLSNSAEFTNITDPTVADTDFDGLTDGAEVNVHGLNPTNTDTDYDGLQDNLEVSLLTQPFADSDGDGMPDGEEVLYGSNPNDFSSVANTNPPVPFINLDATSLPVGPLNVWSNMNALQWRFRAPAGSPSDVDFVNGVKAVILPGTPTNHYVGPSMPQYFGGNTAWTVDAWILNPSIANEETVFAWGRRGGNPDGSNPAFLHGLSTQFGAASLWGTGPDVGWGTTPAQVATNTVAGQWTYVAYTYNPSTTNVSVYKDGVLANSETLAAPLNLHSVDPSDPRNPNQFGRLLPFRVGAQSDAGGSTSGPFGSMAIAKIRAYNQTLSAAAIAAQYNAERAQFPLQPIITQVRVNPSNGFIAFDWVPAPGQTYAVEANTDLGNPAGWSAIATGLTSGSYTNDPAGAPSTFYRLRVE